MLLWKDKEILNPEDWEIRVYESQNTRLYWYLYVSGYRIIASIKCSGGHYLTNQLLRKVFQNKENFSILEIKEELTYINK